MSLPRAGVCIWSYNIKWDKTFQLKVYGLVIDNWKTCQWNNQLLSFSYVYVLFKNVAVQSKSGSIFPEHTRHRPTANYQ